VNQVSVASCIAALIVSIAFSRASAGTPPVPLDAVSAVSDAVRAWDFAAMTNAASRLASMPAGEGEAGIWVDYWTGVALFHAVVYQREEKESGNMALDVSELRERAIDRFKRVVAVDPGHSESHAMISVLNGMAIDDHPISALWRGRDVLRHKKLALETGPDNPRTSFLMGVGTFKRAGRDDAEVEKAIDFLTGALEDFQRERERGYEPWQPAWGRDHVLLFLGRAYERLGKTGEALGWYEQALAENERLPGAQKGVERCTRLTENE